MYNNNYMYGVERSNEYLAHYGIRGMKWGVRKAIKSGNSARLSKQYAKASKKLAKLEKRAANSGKYAKRAALMGAGAAAAGGLAAVGTTGVSKAYRAVGKGLSSAVSKGGRALYDVGVATDKLAAKLPQGKWKNRVATVGRGMRASGKNVNTVATGTAARINAAAVKGSNAIYAWGKSNSIGNAAGNALIRQGAKGTAAAVKNVSTYNNLARTVIKNGKRVPATAAFKTGVGNYAAQSSYKMGQAATQAGMGLKNVSNNTIARIGAGVIGAGLAAGAAKNAYRAATAKKKAAKFKTEMNKAFAGTKYANGGQPRQGKKRRR